MQIYVAGAASNMEALAPNARKPVRRFFLTVLSLRLDGVSTRSPSYLQRKQVFFGFQSLLKQLVTVHECADVTCENIVFYSAVVQQEREQLSTVPAA
jgi:hypothetical protein